METELSEASAQLPTPAELLARLPLSASAAATVARGRQSLRDALHGRDPRFVAIVGPCSLHDAEAALDYAERLARLARELGDALILVMRTYCEKPRSALGWKGLISDPRLDDGCDLALGLTRAREILVAVNALGVPCASEILDPIVRHYLGDSLAWACVGARTSESQIHREMASGLPLPVGIKNPTSGDLAPAVDSLRAARSPQRHLGVSRSGGFARITTRGNPDVHLVLRGGARGANYSAHDLARAAALTAPFGLARPLLVDCSHGNSNKDPLVQPEVFESVLAQFEPSGPLLGAMLESHLAAGRQAFGAPETLAYGMSVTDACLGWDDTEALLRSAARGLRHAIGTAGRREIAATSR
jgi:3-deoxy-7-phosphoheptulonate synthase